MPFDPMRVTDYQARQFLERLRWPKGAVCPRCKKQDVTTVEGGRDGLYNCRPCCRQFTVTVGTIFEGSHILLSKWVQAFHLVCSSKKGMSALQLSRMLGITYKSAWHMAHRIRYVMRPPRGTPKLSQTVEVDETYVGGKPSHKAKSTRQERKTPVVAMVQREGPARATPTKRLSSVALLSAVQKHVGTDAQLMTDEWKAYSGLDRVYDGRESVTHSAGEYVRGNVHTNTVESFFALLKRGIMGSYHHVSRKHLPRYCDEFAFRWSHRDIPDQARTTTALQQTIGKRLPYKQIIGVN
ncbi:MAG: IS1595 family transposase [Candidatus Omnitrophica bacterium]|nr:IS1595 family transposase [Candidatus Omnitrophota bacterium]